MDIKKLAIYVLLVLAALALILPVAAWWGGFGFGWPWGGFWRPWWGGFGWPWWGGFGWPWGGWWW